MRGKEKFSGKWPIICIFVLSFIWALLTASVGWNHTLSDMHGFRQTQTAITSYYFMRGGPFLRYETPVLGAPWSVPFEFPLYQWIVAVMAESFHTALEPTGRFVNEVFFGLSLVMVWELLSEFGLKRLYRLVFLTLMLVSPQYVFWSRTFMIESTALFFCLAYLLFFVRYIRTRRAMYAIGGGLSGILGTLVKLTTFPSFLLVGSLLYAFSLRHKYRPLKSPKALLGHVVPVLTFICLPIFAAWLWVSFTDQIKALNPIAANLTSSSLKDWNFGSLYQRLSSHTWGILFFRTIPDLLGNSSIVFLPLFGFYFARQRLVPFLICVWGFLSAFLLFTNLHVVHNYYAYANGFFLIGAISWCVVGLLESKKWLLGQTIFLTCTLVCIGGYYGEFNEYCSGKTNYSIAQKENRVELANFAQVVKRTTHSDDVIIVLGLDWSSELPYYSQRRALMWPSWMEGDFDTPTMKEALSRLRNNHIGALVLCNKTNPYLIQRATSNLGLATTPVYEDSRCSVYFSPAFSSKR